MQNSLVGWTVASVTLSVARCWGVEQEFNISAKWAVEGGSKICTVYIDSNINITSASCSVMTSNLCISNILHKKTIFFFGIKNYKEKGLRPLHHVHHIPNTTFNPNKTRKSRKFIVSFTNFRQPEIKLHKVIWSTRMLHIHRLGHFQFDLTSGNVHFWLGLLVWPDNGWSWDN